MVENRSDEPRAPRRTGVSRAAGEPGLTSGDACAVKTARPKHTLFVQRSEFGVPCSRQSQRMERKPDGCMTGRTSMPTLVPNDRNPLE
jgi:hypothetical protein